jgi:hypothetical protein
VTPLQRAAILGRNRLRPTWSWDFARYGRVPPGTTYTGSGGYYFNSSGVLTAATTNVPRFDYDPATLSPLGYLAEMPSTNNVQRSAEFDNAYWTKQRGSVVADQVVAPDGTTTAEKFTEDNTTGAHCIYRNITVTSDTYYGLSLFVKAGTRDKFFISMQGAAAGNSAGAVYDLATVTVSETKTGGTSGTIASTQIRAVGNGWYRIGLVAKITTASITNFEFGPMNASTGLGATWCEPNYTGDNSSYGYYWGAQFDSAGVGVTSYIPTAGSTASRTQDVLSMPLTSLPGWSASQGGVLVAAYRLHTLNGGGYDQPGFSITDAGPTNYIRLQTNESGGGRVKFQVVSGGASQLTVNAAATPALFTRSKAAGGWGTARIGVAIDGGAVVGTSGSYSLPVNPPTIYFGSWFTQGLNGTLESIAYYRGARSDAFVQAVSR